MQELEEIKGIFEWFLNLEFTFCDVEMPDEFKELNS